MKILKFLLIVFVFVFAADVGAEESEYVAAVRTFADNAIQYGKDVYGPKQTPLFVDGINVDTHQPPEWKKDGETWILSNMALRLVFPLPLRRQRPNLRQQRHIQPNKTIIRGYAEFDRASPLPVIPAKAGIQNCRTGRKCTLPWLLKQGYVIELALLLPRPRRDDYNTSSPSIWL